MRRLVLISFSSFSSYSFRANIFIVSFIDVFSLLFVVRGMMLTVIRECLDGVSTVCRIKGFFFDSCVSLGYDLPRLAETDIFLFASAETSNSLFMYF